MKKNQTGTSKSSGFLPEYRLNYGKAKPNRFAASDESDRRLIMLDPDVARAFPTAKSVNTALRAFLKAMPPSKMRR